MIKKKFNKTADSFLVKQAIELIAAARKQTVRQTNSLMVFTYFHLGRLIVEHEQGGKTKATYGEETIKELSKSLTKQFGQGFSDRNLEQMRLFFVAFKHRKNELPIPQTLSAKSLPSAATSETLHRNSIADIFPLSWSHYVILSKIKDSNERLFYVLKTSYVLAFLGLEEKTTY